MITPDANNHLRFPEGGEKGGEEGPVPSSSGVYTTQSAWKAIRVERQHVPWSLVVWFTGNVPRWAFIVWLAGLKRLATKDRLWAWGMVVSAGCVLCNQGMETHGHLFFDCSYAKSIWSDLLGRNLVLRWPNSWDYELVWVVKHCKVKGFRSAIYKLSLAAAIYHIWLERNARVFTQKCSSPDLVVKAIVAKIRDRICSWGRVPYSYEHNMLCHNWSISPCVISRF